MTYSMEFLALIREPDYWKPTWKRCLNLHSRYNIPHMSKKPGMRDLFDFYEHMRLAHRTWIQPDPRLRKELIVDWNESLVDYILSKFNVDPPPTIEKVCVDFKKSKEFLEADAAFRKREMEERLALFKDEEL